MAGIGFQQREVLVGESANSVRKAAIGRPEIRAGEMLHRSRVVPFL